MRLIDADALRARAMQATETNEVSFNNCFPYWQFSKCIKEAPTVDAVPVVRGEWIEKTYIHEYANEETEERQYVVCGICGKQPPSGFGAVNFCPNCGAKREDKS